MQKKYVLGCLLAISNFTLGQSHTFLSASLSLVSNIQITKGPPLSLKDDVAQHIDAARLAGTDHIMSSSNMHKFLDILLHLVARPVCTVCLLLT